MVLRACPVLILLATVCAAQATTPVTKYSDKCTPGQYSKEKPCATAVHATYTVDPEYPEAARRDRIQGTVVLQAKVSKDGRASDIKVLQSVGHGLDEAAIKAVARWRYEPATLNGEPVEVVTRVEVNFRLTNEPAPPLLGPVSGLDASKLFAAASSAHGQNDCNTAVQLATRVTQLVPNHYDAWNLLGLCYIERGELKQAEAALKRQIEVAPDHLYAYNNLGRVYLRTHEYDRAIVLFRRQLELNPQDRHAHQNIGHALRLEHKCDEAIGEYQIAASMRPGDPLPHIGLAECYFDLRDTTSALAQINKAVPFISNSEQWNEVAWTMAENKADLPHAEQYARAAIAMESAPLMSVSAETLTPIVFWKASHLTSEWDTLGWILDLEGKLDEAEQYLLPAWRWSLNPTVAAHLASLYSSSGKTKAALEYSSAAVEGFKARPELAGADARLFDEARRRLGDIPLSKQPDGEATAESFTVPNTRKIAGSADFAIVQDPVSRSASARLLAGNSEMHDFESAVADRLPGLRVPADMPIKVVRWGTLKCESAGSPCVFRGGSLHEAMAAHQRNSAQDSTVLNPTPREFSSPTIGVSLTLPESWKSFGENVGDFNHAALVWFSKVDTLAQFVIGKERLEAGPEDFEHMFRHAVGDATVQRHWSEASVQRDGVAGSRFIVDYERAGVNFHAIVELFTLGDLHFTVLAIAPTDEFGRYAADFKTLFESLHFSGTRLAEKGPR